MAHKSVSAESGQKLALVEIKESWLLWEFLVYKRVGTKCWITIMTNRH